ncbi:GGDEF domain-containing protein [Caballeronia sp. LZ065]|uniref:GGDEF domain-containing protein n=1 Tax=Caballeronia sp. LZ065 TaxID=3038571 RepID=UPI00285E0D6A|nr:GGDEF domain-containing protein [Caballeronia sp. LZ065]MDR5784405.1 GGDEF domain-containing protein [Caballeronia sp. LZ065]
MEQFRQIVRLETDSDAPELVAALLHSFSAGNTFLGVYDDRDYLRYANDSFLRRFGLEAGQVATFVDIVENAAKHGRTVRIEAHDTTAFIADAQNRRRVHVHDARQRSFPVDFVTDDWLWCTETLLPNGWIVLTGADITSLKRHEQLLSKQRDDALRLSGLDELTGVPNRRSVMARLELVLAAWPAETTAISVALLDLDYFKSINDTFGHETGDLALRHFAQYCLESLPRGSIFGRFGGEEFLLVLPGTSSDEAKSTLQTLLGSIPPVSSRIPAQVTISLSFSAGIAEIANGESRDDLLHRADRALYLAKSCGRNRVEVAERPATGS